MAWDTKSTRNRGYNEERARERLPHVRQEYGRNKYVVEGFDSDALSAYPVTANGNSLRNWWCKCQDLKGGQWRPVCTHKGAVELYRERGEQGIQVPIPTDDENSAPERPERVPPPPSKLSIVPEPDHHEWGEPALPEWVKDFRDHQQKAIYQVHHAFNTGADVVFLDAPTGSGKTLIGEAVRRRLGGQAIYTCTTKTLQQQFLNDYDYSKVLKGRANYDAVSEWGGQSCKKCPCTPNRHCRAGAVCPGMGQHGQHVRRCPDDPCPYRNAKWDAIESDIAVLNLAYLLAETNFVDNSAFRNTRELTIIDEADLLENIVMDFVEVRVSMKWQNKLNLQPPEVKTYDADSNDWLEWSQRALRVVNDYIRRKEVGVERLPDDEKMDLQEELEKASGLKAALIRLKRDLASEDEDTTKWVYCVDPDTEILTKRGWLHYSELKNSDVALSLDPATDRIVWEPIQSINVFPYKGKMLKWQGRFMDSLSTPNHRWVTQADDGHLRFEVSEHLVNNSKHVITAGGETHAFSHVEFYDTTVVEAVGWYVTEGCNHDSGGIQVNQSLTNQEYCKRLDRISDWLSEHVGYTSSHVREEKGMKRWYWGKKVGEYLRALAPEKQITMSFLTAITKDQAESLLETLISADGHRRLSNGEESFTQQDKGRTEGFQILCSMLGKQFSLRWNETAGAYCSSVVKRRRIEAGWQPHNRGAMSWVDYEGLVWCPSLRTGTWMARRNGTPYWTGNTGYEDVKDGEAHSIIFKPVTVDRHAPDVLWNKGNKFLLMSASIISPGLMAQSLGLDDDEWDVVYVPSTFPPENRPIKLPLIAKMSYKNKERARPKMLKAVQGVLQLHQGERALIHTHSYHLTRYLAWNIGGYVNKSGSGVWTTEFAGRQVYTYTSSYGRDEALKRYRETPGSALLAPSLDRGTDLPGELCRVMAICKVPYPYLGDKQVNARLYGTASGQTWYALEAVRSIVQMTGRGVRSRDDHATCVAPGTKILTNDLRWVPAEALDVGDEILGFDEKMGTRENPRRWRDAVVEATGIETSTDRYRIVLEDGEELVATGDHRWLSKNGQSRDNLWVRTDKLKAGYRLNRYVNTWSEPATYEKGWLAGLYDGDGCLQLSAGQRNRHFLTTVLSQKPGDTLQQALELLKKFNFKYAIYDRSGSAENVQIQGGHAEQLRFLGQIRPERLLDKFVQSERHEKFRGTGVEVVSVEPIEDGPVVTLQSSTETYIAEGFAAHNTYILDRAFKKLYRSQKSYFPDWWKEALDWSGEIARTIMRAA